MVWGLLLVGTLWIARRRGVIGPGALRGRHGRDVSAMPASFWFMAGLIAVVAREFGAGIGLLLTGGQAWDQGLARSAVVALCGPGMAAVVGGIGLGVARWSGARDGAGLRARWSDGVRGVLWLLMLTPALAVAGLGATLLYTVITGAPPARIAHATLDQIVRARSDPWVWAVLFGAVVVAPIAEELIFRVFLQSAMLRLVGSPWIAVIVTGVLFALSHRVGASPVPWQAIGILAVLGIGLGAAYERTRSIGVPITIHAAFNAANVAAAVWLA